jgi:hypothetical protein
MKITDIFPTPWFYATKNIIIKLAKDETINKILNIHKLTEPLVYFGNLEVCQEELYSLNPKKLLIYAIINNQIHRIANDIKTFVQKNINKITKIVVVDKQAIAILTNYNPHDFRFNGIFKFNDGYLVNMHGVQFKTETLEEAEKLYQLKEKIKKSLVTIHTTYPPDEPIVFEKTSISDSLHKFWLDDKIVEIPIKDLFRLFLNNEIWVDESSWASDATKIYKVYCRDGTVRLVEEEIWHT